MLVLFFLLPAGLGTLLAWWLVPLSGAGRWTLWLGIGLAFGMALAAGSIWLLDLIGWSFSIGSLAGVMILTGLVSLALVYVLSGMKTIQATWPASSEQLGGSPETLPWARWLVWILAAVVVFRYLTLLPDLLMRPVFPWDAWKLWAWKARVWFEFGELVPFVSGAEWLEAGGDEFVMEGGHHPHFVSLLMLYPVLVIDYWDDSLIGIAWLVAGISAALMVHGLLRHLGAVPWLAWLGVSLLVSAPMFVSHVVLFGYADFWVMLYMLVFGVGLLLWIRHRGWQTLSLMLFAGLMMSVSKDTGVYWLPALSLAWLATLLSNWVLVIVVLVSAGLGAALLLVGVDPLLWLSSGRYGLEAGVSLEGVQGIVRHLFVRQDWLLAWYVLPVVFGLAAWRARFMPELRGLLVLSLLATTYTLAGFVFTRAAEYAADGTLFSRIVLQFYPLALLLSILVMGQCLQSWRPDPKR